MLKMLIIDDDQSLRKIYSRFFSSEGFEVSEAQSSEQVLLGFHEVNFDVILLDIRMPTTNGLSLMPALQHFHPGAKIIVSSCYSLDFQKRMIEDAADYFNKSDGCLVLLSKIKKALSKESERISDDKR